MASRALLQRASGRGALHRIHRVTVASTVYLSKNFSTPNNIENSRNSSTSAKRTKELSEMSEEEVSGLKVKEDRLMRDLHETCEWGKGERWGSAPTETGMSRLSLSDADKKARDWFAQTTESLGCVVTTDFMGNQFAIRPGTKDGPPTVAGSHLDTQPTGGRYDGILGVTAGIEMLRTLHDNDITTSFPVGVVNWTNEEGARFPISMVSSGVWAGCIPLSHAHDLKEVGTGTATMKSELQRIGYLGEVDCNHETVPLAAHFELHIEQGPILEAEERKIGIVQGVQAYKWFTVKVRGADCHTGTTSFSHRADAMLAAAKMIVYSHRAAAKRGALASTGILQLKPGSTNTVPGSVDFSLDIRSPDDHIVEEVEKDCRVAFAALAAGDNIDGLNDHFTPSSKSCEVSWILDTHSPATKFHPDCISCVESAASSLFGNDTEALTKPMTSGAGHDSVYTSKRVPTTMIFVPSRDGVSHNPVEYTRPEDCAMGAQVLMQAVLRYDIRRAEGKV
ncbi:Zn-dependent exopeptidase [Aureobasidium namibiae CBS 147.97]|uniref:Zn-dependent exopeptidase n=1 Tax=Aureobasidium namibiae CBS 147.97 TaxID=1043004 RepID=A0A074WDR7_9PEZI|nr:Zn-dependent exopeptidase [Aureobasidium namibiae CBS 147.97]KEQ69699.1 Zn-dependent exopeptidase [Aureobasidium namibiae CBS 147.97]